MNLKDNTSVDQLSALIRLADDEAGSHSLWVGSDGEVHLQLRSDMKSLNPEGCQFRLESFAAGNGYIGPRAANDEKLMLYFYNNIIHFWESGAQGYQDYFPMGPSIG